VSQPPPFNRSFSFNNFQAANPSAALPGNQVDLEFNNVKATLDATLANIKLIQRDDGALKNGSVTYDTLSASLQTAGIAPATPWVTATAYAVGASVTQSSKFYRCLIAHTSGTFATDLAAANWLLIVDLSAIALVAANQISVTPSGVLTTDVQGSLQALDTGKAPLSHTQVSSTISDSTAAGRALLTAADVPTQQSLLSISTLGFQSGDIKETACPVLQSGWYYCDGSNKSRTTDLPLFNAITIQQSGTIVSGSAIVTGLTDTSNMSPGMPISAAAGGVSAATVIQSVDSATQVTMSANATGSGTVALVFAPYGVGDGSTTFGLPNRVYLAVGRDNASAVAANVLQVSTTISVTIGSAAATVASAAGLFVGMYVSQPKIPIGTKISAISGTSVTLSANATGTLSSAAVRFSPVLDAQTLGAKGGALSEATTLVTANLPAYTPAGSVSVASTTNQVVTSSSGFTSSNAAGGGSGQFAGSAGQSLVTLTSTGTLAGTAQGGTSAPFSTETVQPTIVMNYIIKR
jgi:hypothetical protein